MRPAVHPLYMGSFSLARASSARTAQPGAWWWSAQGNIRVRCPLCTRPYRLHVSMRAIAADGTVGYLIVHRVKDCRAWCVSLKLLKWETA